MHADRPESQVLQVLARYRLDLLRAVADLVRDLAGPPIPPGRAASFRTVPAPESYRQPLDESLRRVLTGIAIGTLNALCEADRTIAPRLARLLWRDDQAYMRLEWKRGSQVFSDETTVWTAHPLN